MTCSTCQGTGDDDASPGLPCSKCWGRGEHEFRREWFGVWVSCLDCGASCPEQCVCLAMLCPDV